MNRKRFLCHSFALYGLLLLMYLLVSPVSAQGDAAAAAERLEPALHFRHLTSDDGLAQNTVEAILQDSRGFMWIGTRGGLSRYDGYRFVTYRNDPENPNSLSQNWVRDLYEDADGMIWIATEGGGVNKFDPRSETFITRYLPVRENPNSLAGDRVLRIFQDRDGNLWFMGIGATGLNKFDPRSETFTRYGSNLQEGGSFQGGPVRDMVEDEAGNLWMAASDVLAKYDPLTNNFSYYRPPAEAEAGEVRVVHRDTAGQLWVGGTAGLYRFTVDDEGFTLYPGIRGVNDLLEDETGSFWVATERGLYVFDPRTGQVTHHYHHDATRVDSLNHDRVVRLYRDDEGVIWAGTGEAGLNLYDPRQRRFAHYRHDTDRLATLSADTVSAIAVADASQMWASAGRVLDLIDLDSGQVTHFSLEEQGISGKINALYQDRQGIVWIGMGSLTLLQFAPVTGEFTEYPLTPGTNRPTSPKEIVDFYEDPEGALWIAVNHDGLYRLDASRQKVDYYDAPPSLSLQAAGSTSPNAPRPPINDLYGDRAGYIWVATLNGFSRFDPRTGTFQQYRAKAGNRGPDSFMEAIFADRNGLIWVASQDGLIRFDPNTGETRYYTEEEGLPTNFMIGLLEDASGNLWISTRKGLVRFTPATGTFQNFDASDGLQGNEFSPRVFARFSDDRMVFGGINGLTVFYPDEITDSEYRPNVVLTDFQLFNKSVLPGSDSVLVQPISETDSLTLNYDQTVFSFEFAALSYAAPHKNRYRYRLEGFDNDWIETDSARRFATYTSLPAGDYVFRVQAASGGGAWSDKEAVLNLTITPPWWETMWFRAILLMGAIGLILAGYQWRVYAIARQNRLLAKEVARQTSALQERTRELQTSEAQLRQAKEAAESANRAKSAFLASMSHELRSPLNVILGFAQVTNRRLYLPREVQENLGIILRSGEHLLALINQVLDLSKIEAGQMFLNEIDFDLYRLLDDLEEMFILKADDKRLQLVFDPAPDLPRYLHGDAVKLRQVFINLIGNALKFTEKGTVTIRAQKLAGDSHAEPSPLHLQFEVEDTGPGIPPDELSTLFQPFTQTSIGRHTQEGTGLGLTISRRFVGLMGGSIQVRSVVGQGTTFTFDIHCRETAPFKTPEITRGRQIVALEPPQSQYRILVVDDKWANRQLLIKLLDLPGFELREAENGQEAVEMVRDFQPHLVWMDMRMPVMDGLEATRQIKATPQGQVTVVIALTASAYDEERAEVMAAGCDDFVRKPFQAEEIFEILSKHLGVQYVYAGDEPLAAEASDRPPGPDEIKSGMHQLPAELRTRLIESIELGDVEIIEMSIAEIYPRQPALADSLARLARRFEYDELLNMLKDAAE